MAIGSAISRDSSQILGTMLVNCLVTDARKRSAQRQAKHAKTATKVACPTLGSMEKDIAVQIGSFLMTDVTAARNPVGYAKL